MVIANAFIEQAKKEGIEIVAKEGYSDGDKDFKAQLTKINGENPDILMVPEYYELSALIATQAREIGMKSTFVDLDGWDGIIGALDHQLTQLLITLTSLTIIQQKIACEKSSIFLKKIQRGNINEEPTAFSALAYDNVYILKNAN